MKANEFVKQYGFEYSKNIIGKAPESANFVEWYPMRSRFYIFDFGCNRAVLLSELKRLVESHELVESHGGLEQCKNLLVYCPPPLQVEYSDLKQAISDVESCK